MRVQRIHKSGHSYAVTISREYLEALKLSPGDHVVVQLADGQITIEALGRYEHRIRALTRRGKNQTL